MKVIGKMAKEKYEKKRKKEKLAKKYISREGKKKSVRKNKTNWME